MRRTLQIERRAGLIGLVTGLVMSGAFAVGQSTAGPQFVFVPAADVETDGPGHDFRIAQLEIRNDLFVEFLNDALANPGNERGQFLYFDLSTGDVYVNSVQLGESATGSGGRTLKIFSPDVAGQIEFGDGEYRIVNVTTDHTDHPVTGVSWYGALKYCNWLTIATGLPLDERAYGEGDSSNLSQWRPVSISPEDWSQHDLSNTERDALIEKRGFRLPMDGGATGAGLYNEWHKAASARLDGSVVVFDAIYGFGRDDIFAADANFNDSSDPFEPGSTPVAFYDGVNLLEDGSVTADTSNAYAIYDLSGNVWEWMQDQTAADPTRRRARGGSWRSQSASLAVEIDASRSAVTSDDATGFRVVQSVHYDFMVTPDQALDASGPWGGEYDDARDSRKTYVLTNLKNNPVSFEVSADDPWISIEPASGTLDVDESIDVRVAVAPNCDDGLVVGNNTTVVRFDDVDGVEVDTRAVALFVREPISITPASAFESQMPFGGSANPADQTYNLQNASDLPVNFSANWTETSTPPTGVEWATIVASGDLTPHGSNAVKVEIDALAAALLSPGVYTGEVIITDDCTGTEFERPVTLTILEPFSIEPDTEQISTGVTGGPLSPQMHVLTITTELSGFVNWTVQLCDEVPGSATCTPPAQPTWLSLDLSGGKLTRDDPPVEIAASLTDFANTLEAGIYKITVRFEQPETGFRVDRLVTLDITGLSVTPTDDVEFQGPLGGPFAPEFWNYTIQNTGLIELSWVATTTFDPPLEALSGLNWLDVSPSLGVILDLDGQDISVVSLSPDARLLPSGRYAAAIAFTANGATAERNVTLVVGSESFTVAMSSVPASHTQPGGPVYGFRVGTNEITNGEYARFINAAYRNALGNTTDARSDYMYFDLESGDILINDQQAATIGTGSPPSILTTPLLEAGVGGAISYDGFEFVVDSEKTDFPVVGVSWYGAVKFCNWLTLAQGMSPDQRIYTEASQDDLDGWHPSTITTADWVLRDLNDVEREALLAKRGFRLPMDHQSAEAGAYNEWYKAAAWIESSERNVVFGFGRDSLTDADANYRDSADPHEPGATPVGFFDGVNTLASDDPTNDTENGYGINDLAGNVAEWMQDRVAGSLDRRTRGGHFNNVATSLQLRTDGNGSAPPALAADFIGFRLAQIVEPVDFETSQDAVRVEGFVGGPLNREGFSLDIINLGEQTIDNLVITIDSGWLEVDGLAPTLIPGNATIAVPLIVTVSATSPGVSPAPPDDFALVSASDDQPGGVDYDFWIGRAEVTNEQFAAFLNGALVDASGETPTSRSHHLYFDSDSGSVYLNDQETGEVGNEAPDATRTTLLYDATIGRIPLIDGAYSTDSGFENHPVVGVTWYGAVKFCNWLTASQGIPSELKAYAESPGPEVGGWHPVVVDDATWLTGPLASDARRSLVEDTLGYRLPMDDESGGASLFNEWHKAASRGKVDELGGLRFDGTFGFGRDELRNIDANYFESGDTQSDQTTPVRFFNGAVSLFQEPSTCFPPLPDPEITENTDNGYGLYDATGNVAEWMQDFVGGDSALRGTRGGSWRDPSDSLQLTTTERAALPPESANDYTGLRIVRGIGHLATVSVRDAVSGFAQSNHFILHLREPFKIEPRSDLLHTAMYGEALNDRGTTYALTNQSAMDMDWQLDADQAWVDVSMVDVTGMEGTISTNETLTVDVRTNSAANSLAPGDHQSTVTITNVSTGSVFQRNVELTIDPPVTVTLPTDQDLAFVEIWEGPFESLPAETLELTSAVNFDLDYEITTSVAWLMIEPEDPSGSVSGTISSLQTIRFLVSPTAEANTLAPGTYRTNIIVRLTDTSNGDLTWTIEQEATVTVREPIQIAQALEPWLIGPNPDPNTWPPQDYTIANLASFPTEVAVSANVEWLTISDPIVEILPGVDQTQVVRVSVNEHVLTLFDGDYEATLTFQNTVTGLEQCRNVELSIVETLSVAPFSDYVVAGAIGQGVAPPLAVYRATNVARDDGGPLNWLASTITPGTDWILLNGANTATGSLADGETTQVLVTIDPSGLLPGDHEAEIGFVVLPDGDPITRTVRLTLVQPAFSARERLIPADARQPLGPEYDYFVATFHTTNTEFVAFLNDSRVNLDNERGQYLFFDTLTGLVYVNSSQLGGTGPDPEGRSEVVFDPSVAAQIELVNGAYQVVTTPFDYAEHPVAGVGWYGALKYANWLTLDQGMLSEQRVYTESTETDLDGWHPITITTANWAIRDLDDAEREGLVAQYRGYRLPMDQGFNNNTSSTDQAETYNEWYKAAAWNDAQRRPTLYGFGRDSLSNGDANFLANGDPFDDGTTPAGFFDGLVKNGGFETVENANGFGLFDMTGNAYHWLQGRFNTHANSINSRSVRGGSWQLPVESPDLLASGRNHAPPGTLDAQLGFRIVRVPPSASADFNADGAVDGQDHLAMTVCLDGPASPTKFGCQILDLAADGHIDLKDVAVFQSSFTGSP